MLAGLRLRGLLFRRPISLRSHLTVLVLATLLPVIILSAFMFWRDVELQRAAVEQGMRETAHALSLAVDREVGTTKAVLETLTASAYLDARDFGAFYRLCVSVAQRTKDARIILFDRSGQQIINTAFPFGTKLPNPLRDADPRKADPRYPELPLGGPDAVRAVLATGQSFVSDLFVALSTKKPTVAISTPVQRGRQVVYVLEMSLDPAGLTELLREHKSPVDWFSAVLDRRGIVIAHTLDPERFVGQRVRPEHIARAAESDEGWDSRVSLEGIAIDYAFSRSMLTGWTVDIAAPQSVIYAPLNRSIRILSVSATLLILLALGIALTLARRISMPITSLASSAEAIQRGEPVDLKGLQVREIAHLSEALSKAGAAARSGLAEHERRLIAETKQKEAEAAKHQVTNILESMSDGFSAFDTAWRFTYINGKADQELARQYFKRGELLGRGLWDVFPEQVGTRWYDALQRAMRERVPVTCEFHYLPLDEWYEDRVSPTPDGGIAIFRRNITDRKRAEKALGEYQGRFSGIINSAMDAIIGVDQQQRIVLFNLAAEEMFGCPATDALGNSLERFIPARFREAHNEHIEKFGRTGVTSRRMGALGALSGLRASGEEFPIEASISHMEVSGKKLFTVILRDITARRQAEDEIAQLNKELERRVTERTQALEHANAALLHDMDERKKLEAQLLQAQKMESIGTLAGGIAHDFNNILHIIQAYASVLTANGAQREKINESVTVINDTVKRGAALVQQLLTVARKSGGVELELLNLNVLVEGLLPLLKEIFPKTIDLICSLKPDLPPVMADKNQIEQALLNLCVNSRDAMPHGGRLTFKTQSVDGADLQPLSDPAQRYVCIEVNDVGVGIDESIRERIFEPFFTTKDKTQGTGLGLSMVYGIVKNHNGFVDVESKPMIGTSFRLYFPTAPVMTAKEPAVVTAAETPSMSNGAGTILLAEDEASMLYLLEKIFLRRGYKVLKANNGQAALDMYEQHKKEIQVVLLDMGLPKISGRDVLLKIRSENPDVKIIVTSGYIEPEMKLEIDHARVKFLHKPFTPQDVFKALQSLAETVS